MTKPIINKTFKTPIGIVACGLTSDVSNIEEITTIEYKNGNSTIYQIDSCKIELIEFKVRQPLYNGETTTDSSGWIWRIETSKDMQQNIQLHCALIEYQNTVEFEIATGEHLDAIEASDDKWILHIGTEDGEILNSRAELNDWFPRRLSEKFNAYQSITKILKNGFQTNIPKLQIGENIQIQYLTAYDQKNEESVNTWLAVDEFKNKLENWIGLPCSF